METTTDSALQGQVDALSEVVAELLHVLPHSAAASVLVALAPQVDALQRLTDRTAREEGKLQTLSALLRTALHAGPPAVGPASAAGGGAASPTS